MFKRHSQGMSVFSRQGVQLLILFFILFSISLIGCAQDDFDVLDDLDDLTELSSTDPNDPMVEKAPLVFDESTLLPPKMDVNDFDETPLTARAQTYYDIFPNQIGYSDYETMVTDSASWPAGTWNIFMKDRFFTSPANVWLERTYSSRFLSYPDNIWVPEGEWLKSGDIGNNERVEMHWLFETPKIEGYEERPYAVKVEWEVSSEPNYDFLYINSTGEECGDSGVIQLKTSGQDSGFLEFDIPSGCKAGSWAWVGIYYIKDYSVSSYDDVVKIKDVTVGAKIPVGVQ